MWTTQRTDKAVQTLRRYGRPYRSILFWGILWTVGVALFRIALPWPLRGLIEAAFPSSASGEASLIGFVPSGWDPVLYMIGAYVVFAVAGGLCELMQRTRMAKFATGTVHDMRSEAMANIVDRRRRGGGTPVI